MSEYIYRRAERLVQRFGTRDPFEIAAGSGVYLSFRELGGIKGFYRIINRERHIVINRALSREDARAVCAHELGHDSLHRPFAQSAAIKELTLFDMSARPEYEANLFAADLMVGDGDILGALRQYDISQSAALIGISAPLAVCKLFSLRSRGMALDIPVDHIDPFRNDFAKQEAE